MAQPPSLTFSVRRGQPELIVPAEPTPRQIEKLSDIDDQEGLRFQIPFIMFYRGISSMKGKDPVMILRKALSEALVYYYPLAGRLVEGPNKKLMVDCNGKGILFIEADADITIERLGDLIQPPCPCIDELLYDVPGSAHILGSPLLLIQVTRLACGGFIFAIRLNHTMSDSVGLAKFLNATAEFARGATSPSLFPVWQREILCARNPPQVTCVHNEYEEIKDPKNTTTTTLTLDKPNMVHRSFFFGPKEIKAIKYHLPHRLRIKCSNYELLTACLWKCRTEAFELDPNEIVRLSCVINVGTKQCLKLPNGYYGNSFVFPAVLSRAGLLCRNPLGYAVELVKNCKNQMSEEYIRSVTDLMVIKDRPHHIKGWTLLSVDTSHVGLADVDFGWGKPVYGGPVEAFPHICIFAGFRNVKGEDGIVFPIWLPKPVMERFENEILKMTNMIKPIIPSML